MADTIRELCLADLKTALEAIDGTGDYVNSVDSVQRWEQGGNEFAHDSIIIVGGADQSEEYGPDPLKSVTMNAEVDIWIRHNKTDFLGSTDSLISSWIGDAVRAIMDDYTRGGNAQQTDITGAIPFETVQGGDFAGVMLQVEIKYRHNVKDPTSQV